MSWVFVNSTPVDPERSQASRKLVRSHVRQQVQRTQQGLPRRTGPPGKRQPAELPEYLHIFRSTGSGIPSARLAIVDIKIQESKHKPVRVAASDSKNRDGQQGRGFPRSEERRV